MQEHSGGLAKFFESFTYVIGVPVTVAGIIDFIDHHTWIISAVGMFLTFSSSVFFNYLNHRVVKEKASQVNDK
ncbi:MAG: hypothetical protein WC762_03135 [Methylobacter sp.]|jgi:hypothetical protein